MTRVTVALVDLLVQILLKTILYLLETTLFGAPMSANNYVFLRTLLLLLSLSFLPYRSSCLNVLFFEIIMFECFWRFLKLYIWNRMHALHVHPIWRMIQEVSASWTIQVSQACRHTFWHFTLKKNWTKRFYSTSTGRGLKLKDFNIPSGSFWSCTAQQFLAIFGAASRRWKEISNIPMLDSQPWSIAFNFLQWL